MAVKLEATKRFGARSPVARYWLAQCQGFRIRGAGRGTVEEVVSDSDPYSPELLVVRDLGRRREIPVSEVEAVVPAEGVIVVRDRAAPAKRRVRRRRVVVRRGSSLGRQTAGASKGGVAAVGIALGVVARLVGRGAAAAAKWSSGVVRAGARRAAAVGALLVVFARPWIAQGRAASRAFGAAAAAYVRALRAGRS